MEASAAQVRNGAGDNQQGRLDVAAAARAPRRQLRDFEDGEPVDSPFLVVECQLKQRRSGDSYLRLRLSDSSGSVPAIMWEPGTAGAEVSAGQIVQVGGTYEVHSKYGPQVTVRRIATATERVDLEQLVPSSERPCAELEGELDEIIGTVREPHLRELLERTLGRSTDTGRRFRTAPAARFYHEAFRHGLLAHTLAVANGVAGISEALPGVDRDVAVTGALLHDVGKTQEYVESGLAYDQSTVGKLCGHIPLGYYTVRREMERIEGFPEDLATQILHIVLSHHGTLENGSPVVPATREASLVHYVDNLAGQQGNFDRVERTLRLGERWSDRDRALGGPAYFPRR